MAYIKASPSGPLESESKPKVSLPASLSESDDRRILIFTAGRSDLGQLRGLLERLIAIGGSGMSLLALGDVCSVQIQTELTVDVMSHIQSQAVFQIARSDDAADTWVEYGAAMPGIAEFLRTVQPDILVVLGDRLETALVCLCAAACGIPICHIHGGEITLGSRDDLYRHSITKLSTVHFVARDEFRNRLIQMGEQPSRIFVSGALASEMLKPDEWLTQRELEGLLGFPFEPQTLLVTMHPATALGVDGSERELHELMTALDEFENLPILWTAPNADPGGQLMWERIQEFCERRPSRHAVRDLGRQAYLSCMARCQAVVGNSSSGLTEAPALGVFSLDIGERQQGRPRAKSVVHCDAQISAIVNELHRLLAPLDHLTEADAEPPYGSADANGKAASLIASLLLTLDLKDVRGKEFFDLGDALDPYADGGSEICRGDTSNNA